MIYDGESDGLNLVSVKCWQLAWALATGQRITDSFNRFIYWPDLEVSDGAAKVTGFDVEYYQSIGKKNKTYKIKGEISKAEEPSVVLNDFMKDVSNPERLIIGQNLIGFDVFLIASLQKYMGQKPDYSYISRIFDTRALGRILKEGLTKPQKGDFLSYQYKIIHDRTMKSRVSQAQLMKDLNIQHDPTQNHNAAVDIENTFKIFLELKKRMNF